MLVHFKTEEINWNIQQLLISKITNKIVLTNGNHNEETFEGLSICESPEFSSTFYKENFKLFTGAISND